MKVTLFSKSLAAIGLIFGLSTQVSAAPETYTTEANHTFAEFSYTHLGLSTQTSRFNTVSGTVTIDPIAKTGKADITIDTKSVDTSSSAFNSHIQAEDYLSTTQFPTATFKADKFIFAGEKLTGMQGTLTLKGVSKPVVLEVTNFDCKKHPMLGIDFCGANAITKVKRSEFNMGKNVPAVGDEVTIRIAIEAKKGS
jgi:polyisoprenoid-binding protein YceI